MGLVVLALLLLLRISCRVMKRRKRRKQKERFFNRNGGVLLKQQLSSSDGNHVGEGKLFHYKVLLVSRKTTLGKTFSKFSSVCCTKNELVKENVFRYLKKKNIFKSGENIFHL